MMTLWILRHKRLCDSGRAVWSIILKIT
jgi:hypothetical protein